VVKKHTLANARSGMDFNTREPSCKVGDEARNPFETEVPAAM